MCQFVSIVPQATEAFLILVLVLASVSDASYFSGNNYLGGYSHNRLIWPFFKARFVQICNCIKN